MTLQGYLDKIIEKSCPQCGTAFTHNDAGCTGDSYGYYVEDAGFKYTFYGVCRTCNSTTSYRQLGIPEDITQSQDAEKEYIN